MDKNNLCYIQHISEHKGQGSVPLNIYTDSELTLDTELHPVKHPITFRMEIYLTLIRFEMQICEVNLYLV